MLHRRLHDVLYFILLIQYNNTRVLLKRKNTTSGARGSFLKNLRGDRECPQTCKSILINFYFFVLRTHETINPHPPHTHISYTQNTPSTQFRLQKIPLPTQNIKEPVINCRIYSVPNIFKSILLYFNIYIFSNVNWKRNRCFFSPVLFDLCVHH